MAASQSRGPGISIQDIRFGPYPTATILCDPLAVFITENGLSQVSQLHSQHLRSSDYQTQTWTWFSSGRTKEHLYCLQVWDQSEIDHNNGLTGPHFIVSSGSKEEKGPCYRCKVPKPASVMISLTYEYPTGQMVSPITSELLSQSSATPLTPYFLIYWVKSHDPLLHRLSWCHAYFSFSLHPVMSSTNSINVMEFDLFDQKSILTPMNK